MTAINGLEEPSHSGSPVVASPSSQVITNDERAEQPFLSFVIPTYNEEDSVVELHGEIRRVLADNKLDAEIIFVDDGSEDRTLQRLVRLHIEDPAVKVIKLRRNFGKSAAYCAGFAKARGDVVFTLDADLQDDPKEIPRFLAEIERGSDLVSGWKTRRQDPASRLVLTRIYRMVVRSLSGVNIHDFNCGFKAYRQTVIKNLKVYGEMHRLLPVLAHNHGFKIAEIPVDHRARTHGKSKYGVERIVRGPFDLLTTLFLARYGKRPLHFFGKIGALLTAGGLVICTSLTIQWFMGTTVISERPILILGVLLIAIGIQFVSTGLIGEMLTQQHHDSDQEYFIDRIYGEESQELAPRQ